MTADQAARPRKSTRETGELPPYSYKPLKHRWELKLNFMSGKQRLCSSAFAGCLPGILRAILPGPQDGHTRPPGYPAVACLPHLMLPLLPMLPMLLLAVSLAASWFLISFALTRQA